MRKRIREHIKNSKFVEFTNWVADNPWKATFILLILGTFTFLTEVLDKATFQLMAVLLSIFAFLIAIAWFMRGIKTLFNNKGNIYELISGYALAVLGIIFFFSIVYSITQDVGLGYLTYGKCYDGPLDQYSADNNMVNSLSGKVYFSAVTFFTIGYGDICPMGINKGITILNGFFGSIFATIVLAIAIAKYLENSRDNRK